MKTSVSWSGPHKNSNHRRHHLRVFDTYPVAPVSLDGIESRRHVSPLWSQREERLRDGASFCTMSVSSSQCRNVTDLQCLGVTAGGLLLRSIASDGRGVETSPLCSVVRYYLISFTVHTKSGLIRFHTKADWWSCIVSWSVASSS